MKIDEDLSKYIWAVEEINKSLIIGLESAVTVMDQWDDIPHEKREEMITSLRNLVERSKKAFGNKPTKH